MRTIAGDAIIIEDGRILLIKRGTEPGKGMWAVPGGRIEEDETIEQCAIRECKEEAGIDIRIVKLVGIYSDPARDPIRKIIAAAFLCRVAGGILKPQQGEIDDVRWFKLEKLPRLAFDHGKMVEDALKII